MSNNFHTRSELILLASLGAEKTKHVSRELAYTEMETNFKPEQNFEFVNSVDGLMLLPAKSYVQGRDGFEHVKLQGADWRLIANNDTTVHSANEIELPARILYRPHES